MPDVHRKSVGGADVDTSQLRGKVVVVDFFAKFCEPCRRALPALEALHRDAPEVEIVGVAEDESEGDVRELIEAHHLTFQVVHDRGNAISGRYRVTSLPMTFVVGPEGVVRWAGGEAFSEGDLGRVIKAARRPLE